jgi:hypothetical protein
LGDGQASVLLDRTQAGRAVASGSGQDDADGAVALVPGQRGQESVDRFPEVGFQHPGTEMQHTAAERE